jgi:polygalacturonase
MRSHSYWLSGLLMLAGAVPLACGSQADNPFEDDDGGSGTGSESPPGKDAGAQLDAATADVGSDRGTGADAAPGSDARSGVDAKASGDAESTADTGARTDAGTVADAGTHADASTGTDAGTHPDAGAATDSGTVADAGSHPDASTGADAAKPVDASTEAAAGGPGPLATGDTRSVSQPSYPTVCATLSSQFKTSQRGSPPGSDDTSRIQSALNTCKGTGHSVVLAVSGSDNAFFAGTLTVSGEALVVNSGVTLFGSNGYSGELLDVGGTNAAIMGPGIIDGRGDLISGTPRLIQASKITNFIVYNVTLENAAKEHLYVEGGNGFTAWNLTIATPADTANTDGIDIDSLTNATVYGSSIEDGDDGIAIKTNSGATSNITVENSSFHGTHGMSIGSQTYEGVSNVLWKDNTVYGSDEFGNVSTDPNGINIKSDVDCGGTVHQVTYIDTCMTGVKHLLIFNTSYGACDGTAGNPSYTDIIVNGVFATSSLSGAYSTFDGLSSSLPLGLSLENVHLDVTDQQGSQDAKVGLFNSNITPSGSGVTTSSVTGSGAVPSCSF